MEIQEYPELNNFINRYWLYYFDTKTLPFSAWCTLKFGEHGEPFVIQCLPDHTVKNISYIDKPDHYSGYSFWEYDEAKQQIIFFEKDHQTVRLITTLPYRTNDNFLAIDVVNTNSSFISQSDWHQLIDPKPNLGGERLAYVMGEIDYDGNKPLRIFQDNGFGIHLIDPQGNLQLYTETQDHLMQHSQVREVILSNGNYDLINQVDFQDLIDRRHISMFGNRESGWYESGLVVGQRDLMIEFLDAIIIQTNKYQLTHNNTLPAWELIFNQTVEKYFKDRINIL